MKIIRNGKEYAAFYEVAGKATPETAGIVKPDGTTITVDENGTISSIASGDVTASGTNIFTGFNRFDGGVGVFTDYNNRFTIYDADHPLPSYTRMYQHGSGLEISSSRDISLVSSGSGTISLVGIGNFNFYNGVTLGNEGKNVPIKIYTNDPIRTSTGTSGGTESIIPQLKDFMAGENITFDIDEVTGQIKISATGGGAGINDEVVGENTTYSSSKIESMLGSVSSLLDDINGETLD